MNNEFIKQLHMYAEAIRILAKRYLPISLVTALKLKEILSAVKTTIRKMNPDYDIVIKRLHLYYDIHHKNFVNFSSILTLKQKGIKSGFPPNFAAIIKFIIGLSLWSWRFTSFLGRLNVFKRTIKHSYR